MLKNSSFGKDPKAFRHDGNGDDRSRDVVVTVLALH